MFPFSNAMMGSVPAFTAHGPISFVGSDAFTDTGAGSTRSFTNLLDASGGVPTLQQNDVVVLCITQSVQDPGMASGTGYTQISSQYLGSGVSQCHVWCGYKIMGATPDTGASYTLANPVTGNFGACITIHVFRGVDTTTPIDAISAAWATGTGSGPADPPALTIATSGACALAYAGENRATSALSPTNFSNPTGFSKAANVFRSAYNNASVDSMTGLAVQFNCPTGSLDPGSMVGSTSLTNWGALSFALRPGFGGASPGGTPSIRASAIQYVNNASSATFALPTGSQAGDMCLIAVGHGFAVNIPSGWSQIDRQAVTNYNGAAFVKVLDSTDISTGSVSISFGGVYYGTIAGVTFVGRTGGVRTFASQDDSAGAASRTVTTDSTPKANDLAIRFGAGRFNGTVTMPDGTQLQTSGQLNSSGVLNSKTISSDGADSATFNYSATPTGDYVVELIVSPVGGL